MARVALVLLVSSVGVRRRLRFAASGPPTKPTGATMASRLNRLTTNDIRNAGPGEHADGGNFVLRRCRCPSRRELAAGHRWTLAEERDPRREAAPSQVTFKVAADRTYEALAAIVSRPSLAAKQSASGKLRRSTATDSAKPSRSRRKRSRSVQIPRRSRVRRSGARRSRPAKTLSARDLLAAATNDVLNPRTNERPHERVWYRSPGAELIGLNVEAQLEG